MYCKLEKQEVHCTHKDCKEEVIKWFLVAIYKQRNEGDECKHGDHHNEDIAGQKTKIEKQRHSH